MQDAGEGIGECSEFEETTSKVSLRFLVLPSLASDTFGKIQAHLVRLGGKVRRDLCESFRSHLAPRNSGSRYDQELQVLRGMSFLYAPLSQLPGPL